MESRLADPTMHIAALRHFEAGRLAEAAVACVAILNGVPRDWLALRMLGHIRKSERAFDQAVHLLAAALQAAPSDTDDTVSMLNDLAEALLGNQDYAGALDCCRRALAHDPRDAMTLRNHGNALAALNRHTEALEQYRLARMVTPDSARLRLNEGIAMLALGVWPEGWERLEARLSIPPPEGVGPFPDNIPQWRGEPDIAGKSILLHAEQGLGDTLQFIRYAPLVAARGARVVLRVQPALGPLFARLPIADTVFTFFDAVPDVDLQCPVASLPLAFRTTLANLPAQVPYLGAPPEYLMLWQALLGLRRRKRIGIAWFGRQNMPHRSLPLHTLAPLLLGRQDVEFHSLQKEMPESDRRWLATHGVVVDHTEDQRNFLDTTALVARMDMVLSIDTAMAHLAGALGKPVWIMLPFSADWRWLVGRSDSPWYPTARLFRQKRPGDWNGVVAEVAQALSV
jgi:tetratricopeptide (TPR) repeat protein